MLYRWVMSYCAIFYLELKKEAVRVMFSARMLFLHHVHVPFRADDDKVNLRYGTKHIESFHKTYAW